MAEYLIQSESLTAIADKIRVLSGTSGAMGLDAMATHVNTANSNVSTEAGLIAQIQSALEGKAAGGGSVETCTVTITFPVGDVYYSGGGGYKRRVYVETVDYTSNTGITTYEQNELEGNYSSDAYSFTINAVKNTFILMTFDDQHFEYCTDLDMSANISQHLAFSTRHQLLKIRGDCSITYLTENGEVGGEGSIPLG